MENIPVKRRIKMNGVNDAHCKPITLERIEWIVEDILDDNGWVNDSHTHAEYKGMNAGLTMLINHLEELGYE